MIWIGFLLFILFLLGIDLGLLRQKEHVVSAKEASAWTLFWIILSLLWMGVVYYVYENKIILSQENQPISGSEASLQYLTGYFVEKSLSLDNIFVIALVFSYFSVPLQLQHRVLTWGILGVLVLRFAMISAGILLINEFAWITYIFGALLLYTTLKLMVMKDKPFIPEESYLVHWARKLFPVTSEFHGNSFFVKIDSRWHCTPLFLALIVVESSDILFAIDSIPAIFAITTEPFIVFTSNIFAVLGLRSMYFLLAAWIQRFVHLKTCLIFILLFISVKMLLIHHYPISSTVSLFVILTTLALGIVASLFSEKEK